MLEMRKAPILTKLLQQQKISPILVDIGSSYAEASVLRPIASESVIIGFDADSRGQDLGFAANYKGHHLVPKAVVFDGSPSVEFVLTQFPPCSSVLEPDLDALKEMIFHDYFVPES